ARFVTGCQQQGMWEAQVRPALIRTVHEQIGKLPSIVRGADRELAHSHIRACVSHVLVIGDGFRTVVDAAPEQLVRSLVQSLGFRLVETATKMIAMTADTGGQRHFEYPQKEFDHFVEESSA